MEAALRLLVPKIIGDVSFNVFPHQCKESLLSKLPNRLQGYAAWLPENYRIVVVVDRDDDNCHELKCRLEETIRNAGLMSRSRSDGPAYQIVSRIVIEELEAWFFGDWPAVLSAYPGVSRQVPQKQGFRDVDAIAGGTWEALERHLQRAGYFRTGLRKIELAKAIAEHMRPDQNTSRSFHVFRSALLEMISCDPSNLDQNTGAA